MARQSVRKTSGSEAGDVVTYMEQLAAHPDQSRGYFAIGFRDSNVRIVFPTDDDPLQYQQQIVAHDPWRLDVLRPEGGQEALRPLLPAKKPRLSGNGLTGGYKK